MLGAVNRDTVVVTWLKKIIRIHVVQSAFARNVILMAEGAAAGQFLTVLVSPILTRLFSPDYFGVFGVYASILGIITVMASLRYEYAMPLPEDDATAANILALCFILLIGTTAIITLLIYRFSEDIIAWVNVPVLKRYLWLVPLGMLGAGIYQILSYWAVRKREFSRIARTKFCRGAARAAIQVGVGFLHKGPLGLILGQLAGETAGSTSLGLAAWTKDKLALKAISSSGMFKAAIRYRRFPMFSSWADLLESLGLQVPQLLFAAFYGASVAGWFALGQRVIAAPLNILVDSVSQVYFGEAARLSMKDPKAMKRLFLKLTGRLAFIGGMPVVLICALSPYFFAFVFGSDWEIAGRYVQILGPMFAVRFAIAPLIHTLSILERQDLYSVWEGLRLFLVVGGLMGARVLQVSHISAVLIYSISMLAAYLILWMITWNALKVKLIPKIRRP